MVQENDNNNSNNTLLHNTLNLNTRILGIALGVPCGLIVFLATIWLVLKGGEVVGPHLQLLSQYFPGYSVTYSGSIIGLFYGFVAGYFSGFFIAWIYNMVVLLKMKIF